MHSSTKQQTSTWLLNKPQTFHRTCVDTSSQISQTTLTKKEFSSFMETRAENIRPNSFDFVEVQHKEEAYSDNEIEFQRSTETSVTQKSKPMRQDIFNHAFVDDVQNFPYVLSEHNYAILAGNSNIANNSYVHYKTSLDSSTFDISKSCNQSQSLNKSSLKTSQTQSCASIKKPHFMPSSPRCCSRISYLILTEILVALLLLKSFSSAIVLDKSKARSSRPCLQAFPAETLTYERHPSNCSIFFICYNHQAWKLSCTVQGTVFSLEHNVCVWRNSRLDDCVNDNVGTLYLTGQHEENFIDSMRERIQHVAPEENYNIPFNSRVSIEARRLLETPRSQLLVEEVMGGTVGGHARLYEPMKNNILEISHPALQGITAQRLTVKPRANATLPRSSQVLILTNQSRRHLHEPDLRSTKLKSLHQWPVSVEFYKRNRMSTNKGMDFVGIQLEDNTYQEKGEGVLKDTVREEDTSDGQESNHEGDSIHNRNKEDRGADQNLKYHTQKHLKASTAHDFSHDEYLDTDQENMTLPGQDILEWPLTGENTVWLNRSTDMEDVRKQLFQILQYEDRMGTVYTTGEFTVQSLELNTSVPLTASYKAGTDVRGKGSIPLEIDEIKDSLHFTNKHRYFDDSENPQVYKNVQNKGRPVSIHFGPSFIDYNRDKSSLNVDYQSEVGSKETEDDDISRPAGTEESLYGRSRQPGNHYGRSRQPANRYGRRRQPGNHYGRVRQPDLHYGRGRQLGKHYNLDNRPRQYKPGFIKAVTKSPPSADKTLLKTVSFRGHNLKNNDKQHINYVKREVYRGPELQPSRHIKKESLQIVTQIQKPYGKRQLNHISLDGNSYIRRTTNRNYDKDYNKEQHSREPKSYSPNLHNTLSKWSSRSMFRTWPKVTKRFRTQMIYNKAIKQLTRQPESHYYATDNPFLMDYFWRHVYASKLRKDKISSSKSGRINSVRKDTNNNRSLTAPFWLHSLSMNGTSQNLQKGEIKGRSNETRLYGKDHSPFPEFSVWYTRAKPKDLPLPLVDIKREPVRHNKDLRLGLIHYNQQKRMMKRRKNKNHRGPKLLNHSMKNRNKNAKNNQKRLLNTKARPFLTQSQYPVLRQKERSENLVPHGKQNTQEKSKPPQDRMFFDRSKTLGYSKYKYGHTFRNLSKTRSSDLQTLKPSHWFIPEFSKQRFLHNNNLHSNKSEGSKPFETYVLHDPGEQKQTKAMEDVNLLKHKRLFIQTPQVDSLTRQPELKRQLTVPFYETNNDKSDFKVKHDLEFLFKAKPGTQMPHPTTTAMTFISTSSGTATTATAPTADKFGEKSLISSSDLASLPPYRRELKDRCGVMATPLIVGGRKSRVGQWPWQVSLQIITPTTPWHRCGGVLVHARWVLTAAHCVEGPFYGVVNNWRVVMADYDLDSVSGNEIYRDVSRIISHPEYVRTSNFPNDVALLELDKPVDITSGEVQTACLPGIDFPLTPGTKCWISGWGETRGGYENVMNEIPVDVLSHEQCKPLWGRVDVEVLDTQVCLGYGQTGACYGDSGGPLMCESEGRYYVAGIMSWIVSNCSAHSFPNVFTRLPSYMDWLYKELDYFEWQRHL